MTSSLTDLDGLPVVGVGLGHPDTAAAEHWLASLDPQPLLACTHLVRRPHPQVAWTLIFAGEVPADLPRADVSAEGGRAVVFPGVELLTGELTVADILARSAIDRVEILGGAEADPSAVVRTNDFVRPLWRDGTLVLVTMPAAGGALVPFETRHPTPCCAAH
ncbi:hypothetical protein [Nucisporomicrobium flavum]|uniref:hypothetical protein n=1 Tax=Nucisporomicrobium flavum TaxID=2785915 RepID=UPI0018F336E9|nr:hypothetical protein [Nucisporomicrobium flavum]